MFRSPAIS
jgi:hypothetical protein